MARSTRKKTSPNAAPSRRRAPARADPPTIEATPLDHLAPDQGSNAPKLPAKPRQKERAPPEKARSLLGALPKKSPPGKRQRRGGDESQLLSPEEQALGPYSMDSVDAKVDAYNAWKDVGRELVRASQLQHAAMKTSRPADLFTKKQDTTASLLLHPEVTVRFDSSLFSLTVNQLLPTVQGLLAPDTDADMFSVTTFPRKPPPPKAPEYNVDWPGFAQFALQRDVQGEIEAAAAAGLKAALERSGKRKKTSEELEKAAFKKARKECVQKLGEEWEALGEAGQKAHVEAEAALLAEHAQALAAHESAAPPTATSFKVALHDPALVQRLLRLPADGFRAVEWHGPYGPVTQQACVRKADLRYDVKDSALKLKCELQYLRGNEVDE